MINTLQKLRGVLSAGLATALLVPESVSAGSPLDVDTGSPYVVTSGTPLVVDDKLTIGKTQGGQTFTVDPGASAAARKTMLGFGNTTNNTLTVLGTFTNVVPSSGFATIGPALTIGETGTYNQFVIDKGGVVTIATIGGDQANDVSVGYRIGADHNKLTVTGAGSALLLNLSLIHI